MSYKKYAHVLVLFPDLLLSLTALYMRFKLENLDKYWEPITL